MTGTPVTLRSAKVPGAVPNLRLAATLYLPASPADPRVSPPGASATPKGAPGLVVGHGAGSRAARHEEFCLEACRRGFAILAPDLRGHGASDGEADGPLELDLLAATEYLRAHPGVDPQQICYRGSSMGGLYGLKAAPLANFAAMVLICPAGEGGLLGLLDSLDSADGRSARDTEAPGPGVAPGVSATPPDSEPDATRWDTALLRTYLEAQDSRELAARVVCPVLLIHARPDAQVPLEHSLLLTRHLSGDATLLALQSGSHSSAQHDPRIHAYSLRWLLDTMAER